jgi:cytoskeletal protein CcmA (bactofilin family)
MSEEKRGSASISGAGTIAGGKYDRVSISGAGKVTGDLVARELHVSGTGKVEGRTEVGRIAASGVAKFEQDVVAEEISASGAMKVEGSVRVKELKTSGAFKATGSIHAEYVRSSGDLHSGGDVEAEIFHATGGFDIVGLLAADKIEIRLGGHCRAREIGGERIEVRAGAWGEGGFILGALVRAFAAKPVQLTAQLIEGDDVVLESTTAETVRGKRIEIGPDCHIETVEYSESLNVHEDAKVATKRKV